MNSSVNESKTMGVYVRIEEYHCPQNLAKALDLLSRFENSGRVIAGGTDILPLRPGVKKKLMTLRVVDFIPSEPQPAASPSVVSSGPNDSD